MNEISTFNNTIPKELLVILSIFNLLAANFCRAGEVQSHYFETVNKLSHLKHTSPQMASNDVTLKCWLLPESELYMGVEQRVHIQAPIESVVKVVEAVNEYVDLFPGYKKVELRDSEKNKFTVFFDQKVPLFFVPNIKFEMLYEKEATDPEKVLYTYRLKERGKIKASDGFIALFKTSTNETDYLEFDFLDADWGLGGALGKEKLWSEVVEGIYWSNLSIKAKAQKPDLSPESARDFAKSKLDEEKIKNCVKSRTAWKSPDFL